MTVIVSVKINDGIVAATDSAVSFQNGMIYQHANKVVNLCKGYPVGAMVTGAAGIGNESIYTLLKDLRHRLAGNDINHQDWKLNPANFTVSEVAQKVRQFIFCEKIDDARVNDISILIRVFGYSVGRPLPEMWDIKVFESKCEQILEAQSEQHFGVRWEGEMEAIDRLLFGLGTQFVSSVQKLGVDLDKAIEARNKIMEDIKALLVVPAMPIQDAIDLAEYLVQTTVGYVRFNFNQPVKTVGGAIEIATITKHEGFKWVQRKHFYSPEIN